MAMTEQEFLRNLYRIPRLVFHVQEKRRNQNVEKAASLEKELKRRVHLMLAEGHDEVVDRLLKLKLAPNSNEDSELLDALAVEFISNKRIGAPKAPTKNNLRTAHH